MFSWLLRLRQKMRVAAQEGVADDVGDEVFPLEGLPASDKEESFNRLKELLAQREASIAMQQQTIAELNGKMTTLTDQVDAQFALIDQYDRHIKKMPDLVAAFILMRSKEVEQFKTMVENSIPLGPCDHS